MERSAPDRSINTTVPAAGVRPSNDGLAVNNPHFSDNRPEAALMMQFQEMADLAGKQAQRHGYAAAGKAGSGVVQRQRGLKKGDAVLVDLYGDERGVVLEAAGEEYRIKLDHLSEEIFIHHKHVRNAKMNKEEAFLADQYLSGVDFGGSQAADPSASAPAKSKPPPVSVTVAGGGVVNITAQMVADYREDIKDLGTYANELEASLLAIEFGISFNIYTAGPGGALRLALKVNGGNENNRLLFSGNHFVVLKEAPEGIYTDADKKYALSDVKTRSDGSCLLDACVIVKHNKPASEKGVLNMRSWLAEKITDDQIKMLLEPILIDIHAGVGVPGLGPKMTAYQQANSPVPPQADPGEDPARKTAPPAAVHREKLEATAANTNPFDGKKNVRIFVKADKKVTANAIRTELSQQAGITVKGFTIPDITKAGIYTITVKDQEENTFDFELHVNSAGKAFDESPPVELLIGTEFTFTNEELINAPLKEAARRKEADSEDDVAPDTLMITPENKAMQRKWRDKMKTGRGRFADLVKVTAVKDEKSGLTAFRAEYSDGWWYQVSLDVSCLELQTKPMTLTYAAQKQQAQRMQTDIFDVAGELGLRADAAAGGGHIHLGLQGTFDSSVTDQVTMDQLFRDFIVDLANNAVALEALEHDPVNSPMIAHLSAGNREAFSRVIQDFDAGKLGGETAMEKCCWLAQGIRSRVYTEEFREPPSGKPQKYQALNVERSYNPNPETPDETRTIELRALRAQRSADEFLKIARLFQARLDYLRKQRLAGEKGPAVNIPDLSTRAKSQNPAIRAAFKAFLQPTGLNQGDYSGILEENLKER